VDFKCRGFIFNFFEKIKNEFLHHKLLNHPNIVKVFELYIDSLRGAIYSVMELIKSKEMFEVIHELGHYSGFCLKIQAKN